MIKIIFHKLFLFIILFSGPFMRGMETTIEVRAAALYHTSDKVRNQYKEVVPSYEVEFSFSCDPCCYAWWVNLSWFNEQGDVKGNNCASVIRSFNQRVQPNDRLNVGSLGLGIKFPYYFCDRLAGYVGIGPVIGNVWLKKTSALGKVRRKSKVAYGGVVKLGIDYYVRECLFVDLFVDYVYEVVHFKRYVDVGGVKAGVGLGVRF